MITETGKRTPHGNYLCGGCGRGFYHDGGKMKRCGLCKTNRFISTGGEKVSALYDPLSKAFV